jgi:hypothetical protein
MSGFVKVRSHMQRLSKAELKGERRRWEQRRTLAIDRKGGLAKPAPVKYGTAK